MNDERPKPLLARWLAQRGVHTTPKQEQLIRWMQMVIVALLLLSSFSFIEDNVAWRVRQVSGSMQPTIQQREQFLVDRITFRLGLRSLQPGDIVIVRSQGFRESPQGAMKRLIALGGQRVKIKDCYVFVNDQPLTDNAFNHPGHTNPQRQCYYNNGRMLLDTEVLVPEKHYFVLGDYSTFSFDSRFEEIGFIKHDDVIGRVYLRIWPPERFGVP
jgi:signal peptidase I